ncbi:MAG TPA: aminotransferase class I/II-fold pyridoxal phosphate-dependent enzyme, partial [Vicinamibacterales bacterium]|nr:aminotransferase class I/II-fold pyridoxal phosphate-dependent enzyme [Vicinamibacterales bacterium]
MSQPRPSVPPSRPPAVPRAEYLLWAKRRPHPAHDLGRSDVVGCTLADLPGARDALELTGRNDDGWEPLVEAVASRYGVRMDQVATATGTSGANFLVCAALLRPGDDVLVERPAYDPLLAVPALLGANVVRFE